MPTPFLFLKLGGSLITDKNSVSTVRQDVLARLSDEIKNGYAQNPGLKLILGHGSGSFGHVPAKAYGTRQGVRSLEGWHGFAEVWRQATALTRIVVEALHTAGLPAVAFSPSASVTAIDGIIDSWDLAPMRAALDAGLLPVVHGDVAFDTIRGGTIVSTEDVFRYLARHLKVRGILIAGIEPGVWADFPACTKIIPEITPASLSAHAAALGGSSATDVTGGMKNKVHEMLAIAESVAGLDIHIFGGTREGAIIEALSGNPGGTRVHVGDKDSGNA